MASKLIKDKEADVLVVNDRDYLSTDKEVIRIDGKTGSVKVSQPFTAPDLQTIRATALAKAANSIDVVCAIVDASGAPVLGVKNVWVRSLAVTAAKGALAAAATAVGTVKKAVSPATGPNDLWIQTTSGGLFSFSVADDQIEQVVVKIDCENSKTKTLVLSF